MCGTDTDDGCDDGDGDDGGGGVHMVCVAFDKHEYAVCVCACGWLAGWLAGYVLSIRCGRGTHFQNIGYSRLDAVVSHVTTPTPYAYFF